MLYQQSLSSAFSMMGDVFSALTAAVGAADKVRSTLEQGVTWCRCMSLHEEGFTDACASLRLWCC